MLQIDVPQEMLGDPSRNQVAEGPFVVSHNGEQWPGCSIERYGPDELSIWDGGRAHVFDDSYTVTTTGTIVTLVSDQYQSTYALRPVSLDDAEWAMPDGYQATTLDQLKEDMLNILLNGV